MPEKSDIVINTGPLISIVAALGNLEILRHVFNAVYVPSEVLDEICIKSPGKFAAKEINEDSWIKKCFTPVEITPALKNMLDTGEASVIQSALNYGISTVCIDETAGRRIARLYGLTLTGSIGIMLKAKKTGFPISIKTSVQNMLLKGIYFSNGLVDFVIKEAGE